MKDPILSGKQKFWRTTLESLTSPKEAPEERNVSKLAVKTLEILNQARKDIPLIVSKDGSPTPDVLDSLVLLEGMSGTLTAISETIRKTWVQAYLNKDKEALPQLEQHLTQVTEEFQRIQRLSNDLKNRLSADNKEQTVWYTVQQLEQLSPEKLGSPLEDLKDRLNIDEDLCQKLPESGIRKGADLLLMLQGSRSGTQHIEIRLQRHLNEYQANLNLTTNQAHKKCVELLAYSPNMTIWSQQLCSQIGYQAGIDNLTVEEVNHLGLGTLQEIIDVVEEEGEQALEQPWYTFLANYLSGQGERLQEIRSCTTANVAEILAHPPAEPSDIALWLEKLVKYYDLRPYIVRAALKEVDLNDELFLEIFQARPLAFDPLPESRYGLLSRCSYDAFNEIVRQAPHLYLAFPEGYRERAFEEFRTNPEKVPGALDGLVRYPLYWDQLFPKLDASEKKKLLATNDTIRALNSRVWIGNNLFDDYPKDEKELAKVRSLFRLGSDQWKLWIDPRWHHLGPEVFDLGLHGGPKEPGYLERMQTVSLYLLLAREVRDDLDWTFYRDDIHTLAVKTGPALMRIARAATDKGQDSVYVGMPRRDVNKFLEKPQNKQRQIVGEFNDFCSQFSDAHVEFAPSLEELTALPAKHRLFLDGEVSLVCKFLTTSPIDGVDRVYYDQMKTVDCSKLSREEKIRHFAKLHQQRERLHVYLDGNSRTNALMLQGDLVNNGLAPAFFDPNASYLESVDSWASTIAEGINEIEEKYPLSE